MSVTQMSQNISVLVADDHPVFREGLCALLNSEDGVDCVGIAEDGHQAIKLTSELLPDVVLLDIAMPNIDGIEAAKQIMKVCPTTAVLILSAYKYDHYVLACLQAGVNGYLLKTTPRVDLINAIRMVHGGRGVFSLEATGKVMHSIAVAGDNVETAAVRAKWHRRHIQILKLAAKGMANKEIARELGISTNTVGTHFINIFRKLGVGSRTEAILYALKEGLFTMEDIVSDGQRD